MSVFSNFNPEKKKRAALEFFLKEIETLVIKRSHTGRNIVIQDKQDYSIETCTRQGNLQNFPTNFLVELR